MSKLFFFLLAFVAAASLINADEDTTDNAIDTDDVDDDSGKEGNYRLVVHLRRPLRLNVFRKRVDGTLTVTVNVNGKEYTENIDIKERLIVNIPIKRAKMSIKGDVDDSTTVTLSFKGEGDGVLTATRVALIPLDERIIGGIKGAMCASFRGSNLLELSNSVTKSLSHRACIGIPIGK